MMQLSAYGRLGGDPRPINTSSGKTMAVASIAVDVEERGNDNPEPEWIGVVAFGGQAEKLLQHAKGETLSVAGRCQRNSWQDRDRNERVQLQVVADNLVSARTVRPSGNPRQAPGSNARSAAAGVAAVAAADDAAKGASGQVAAGEDFDDDVPF